MKCPINSFTFTSKPKYPYRLRSKSYVDIQMASTPRHSVATTLGFSRLPKMAQLGCGSVMEEMSWSNMRACMPLAPTSPSAASAMIATGEFCIALMDRIDQQLCFVERRLVYHSVSAFCDYLCCLVLLVFYFTK